MLMQTGKPCLGRSFSRRISGQAGPHIAQNGDASDKILPLPRGSEDEDRPVTPLTGDQRMDLGNVAGGKGPDKAQNPRVKAASPFLPCRPPRHVSDRPEKADSHRQIDKNQPVGPRYQKLHTGWRRPDHDPLLGGGPFAHLPPPFRLGRRKGARTPVTCLQIDKRNAKTLGNRVAQRSNSATWASQSVLKSKRRPCQRQPLAAII